MTYAVKTVMYTAEVVLVGGRDGHARSSDGHLDVALDTPAELEGSGGPGTNPEQLFAAGYAACFQSALEGCARGKSLDVTGCKITATVGVGPVVDGGGFGLEVRLELDAPSLSDEDAATIMNRAHRRCPYSRAISGNVPVELVANGSAIALDEG
jgi:lipoyl-dependent peroxiredoxin